MADVEKLIEEIGSMTVLELSELVKALEDKFGVSATAPVAAGPAQGASAADAESEEEEEEEQTEFNVVLKDFGEKKIPVIKEVRSVTDLGLREAKEKVEEAPVAIVEGADKETAEEIKQKLEDAGATIELE